MIHAGGPTGANLVAGDESRAADDTFRAVNPRTGEPGDVAFQEATGDETAAAAAGAAEAFETYRSWPGSRIAGLLRGAAAALESLGTELVDMADAETGLGAARLTGERARTCGQLRAFADLVDEGSYVEAIIDTADPDAEPVPRPDLRRMQLPLGPVAVFGASNFPLAFSVPGGDTASALAAGCPVVVKAHPAHPGTSELCARAILEAAADAGAPEGVFSLLHGRQPDVGRALVTAAEVKAVGFTGSQPVGRALYDLAADRPEPIPVYAEMGSLNPIFVTDAALRERSASIADGFVTSMTMGTGQFCTKPGLVFVPRGEPGDAFVRQVADRLGNVGPGPMLNHRLRQSLQDLLQRTAALDGVDTVVRGHADSGPGCGCSPWLLTADVARFLDGADLLEEHFGPVSIIVRAPAERMAEAAAHLAGNLTATIHAEADEAPSLAALAAILRDRAGRVIWNGFPTGVAVTHAMHHGGPYPATTYAAHTSVGTTAIRRFLRPVAFQDAPAAALPDALRDDNPLGIRRLVDGRLTDGPVERKTA